MKICLKCKGKKEFSKFSKDKSRYDGFCNICKSCSKEYRENNKEYYKKYGKEYRNNNKKYFKEYLKEYQKIYAKNKRKNNLNFKIKSDLKRKLRQALKGELKSYLVIKLVGCDYDTLKFHFKKQFSRGMCWENYGYYGWHIDHIIPCANFDLTKEEEQIKCFHYTNLQPLWAEDNMKKGSNIIKEVI